ncbi:MAG TPA: glutamyl-tRNA reductase [Acidimicrobiales bacterium]|nr:glutamyl-tRNA reductase [Acidimicrobiales bacterium]
MSVAVVGMNHRTVPLAALEPMIVSYSDLPKALADLSSRPYLDEVVVVSTCMRTEVYALVNRFHGAMADIREFLSAWSGQPPEDFSGHLYSYFEDAAINHLFRVSSGLDSASLGEPEVLGQVRQAWEVARNEGVSGPALDAAFRHALQVGKRARAETTISHGTTSLSYAAVELAVSTLGSLKGKQALVIGVGDVGESTARAFANVPGALPVTVVNRTKGKANQLAGAVGGNAVGWSELGSALARADVVACCTAGDGALIGKAALEEGLSSRRGRPVLLIDLAVPRNVEPAVASLPWVTLLNMDDISGFVRSRMDERRAVVPAVEQIVAEEVDRYSTSLAARSVAPLVSALHDRAEEIRQAELLRSGSKISVEGSPEREALEAVTTRIVAKLLHAPTVNLKAAAGTAKGEALADAFRDLFDLET